MRAAAESQGPDQIGSVAASPADATPPSPTSGRQNCPACGRFVGPYERCPVCGARMPGRLAVHTLKLIALALATVGLALVWWAARDLPIPTVSISEAGGLMNLAYVRIEGRVTRTPTYDPEGGYLGFWIADGTGEVHVNVYREVTRALIEESKTPALGDTVSVAGTLRVREELLSLTVDVPAHLTLVRATAAPAAPGAITLLDEGQRVRVRGEVAAVTTPYAALTLIDIEDESGRITVAVDATTEQLSGELPEIAPGQAITVEGAVSLYRATPQIVPAAVADVQTGDAPPPTPARPAPQPLSHISADNLGERVCVQGEVVMLTGLRGGVKATLDDGTAQLTLLLWDNVLSTLSAPRSLDVGAEVTVTGRIDVYEGEVEIIPNDAADVEIGVAAPAPPWVELGALTPQDAGRVVRARGVLAAPEGFSAGVKAALQDGTGAITVLFWSNIYEALAPKPQAGLQVEVVGLVDVYRGALELVPRSAFDWRIRIVED